MLKTLTFIIIVILSSSLMAQMDLGYIELNTQNMGQLEVQIEKLNSQGISVAHIFPPNAVMVRIGGLNQDFHHRNSSVINYLPPPAKFKPQSNSSD